jgi:hypothetical protein
MKKEKKRNEKPRRTFANAASAWLCGRLHKTGLRLASEGTLYDKAATSPTSHLTKLMVKFAAVVTILPVPFFIPFSTKTRGGKERGSHTTIACLLVVVGSTSSLPLPKLDIWFFWGLRYR